MPKYRIITFDGGGIRGALSASLLRQLNTQFPALIPGTNFFAGTSTGSFIALGLAYGLSADDLVNFYSENGQYIFQPKYPDLTRPKYNNQHLQEILSAVFPGRPRLKDLHKPVLIPAFCLNIPGADSWGPVLFNNFPASATLEEYVLDVALASSAAPVYFPSHLNYIDGGVVVNNPSTAAICMAVDKLAGRRKLNDIRLLSIGTGYNNLKITADTRKWGTLEWVLYPNPSLPLLSVLFDGVISADEVFSLQLLRERYFRLNPLLPEPIGLDDYKKIPELNHIAESFDLTPALQWLKQNWL